MTLSGHDVDPEASCERLRYVNRDRFKPGAPAGDDSRKYRRGDDIGAEGDANADADARGWMQSMVSFSAGGGILVGSEDRRLGAD